VKGYSGWGHGADAHGRPINWRGYTGRCAHCGAEVFAELWDIEADGTTLKWRLAQHEPIAAAD
jgi:hypothetical protein